MVAWPSGLLVVPVVSERDKNYLTAYPHDALCLRSALQSTGGDPAPPFHTNYKWSFGAAGTSTGCAKSQSMLEGVCEVCMHTNWEEAS